MKIVVTGSSGSVAGGIISYILASTSHSLVLVDRKPPEAQAVPEADPNPRATYITADLLDFSAFLAVLQGADALIHLAGYAQPFLAHPAVVHNTNACLSFNALQGAAEAGVRYVIMASRFA